MEQNQVAVTAGGDQLDQLFLLNTPGVLRTSWVWQKLEVPSQRVQGKMLQKHKSSEGENIFSTPQGTTEITAGIFCKFLVNIV